MLIGSQSVIQSVYNRLFEIKPNVRVNVQNIEKSKRVPEFSLKKFFERANRNVFLNGLQHIKSKNTKDENITFVFLYLESFSIAH